MTPPYRRVARLPLATKPIRFADILPLRRTRITGPKYVAEVWSNNTRTGRHRTIFLTSAHAACPLLSPFVAHATVSLWSSPNVMTKVTREKTPGSVNLAGVTPGSDRGESPGRVTGERHHNGVTADCVNLVIAYGHDRIDTVSLSAHCQP
jgi:hypothetical protein